MVDFDLRNFDKTQPILSYYCYARINSKISRFTLKVLLYNSLGIKKYFTDSHLISTVNACFSLSRY